MRKLIVALVLTFSFFSLAPLTNGATNDQWLLCGENEMTREGLKCCLYQGTYQWTDPANCPQEQPPQQCTYTLSISSDPTFNTITKQGIYTGREYTWTIKVQDSSSASCPSPITYTFSTSTLTGSCDVSRTGIYDLAGGPLTDFSATREQTPTNEFTVRVRRTGDACTLSFNIIAPDRNPVDPSFTVNAPDIPNQPPHVSFFDFSGDSTNFITNWKAFYPDNNPLREMNVKCGLNCDPRVADCSAVVGKGCLPYDAPQGTAEIKEGSCIVSSPAYDFSQTNKIMCEFYDPANTLLRTFVKHDFTPVDFEIRSSDRISSTVGKDVDLKVDLNNKGLLTDSYTVTITAPSTVSVSPASITTASVSSYDAITVLYSVTPLVDETNTITITASSNTEPSITRTKTVELSSELFVLPEFGLTGFLQIIAIATIIYFLLINKNIFRKKRRR